MKNSCVEKSRENGNNQRNSPKPLHRARLILSGYILCSTSAILTSHSHHYRPVLAPFFSPTLISETIPSTPLSNQTNPFYHTYPLPSCPKSTGKPRVCIVENALTKEDIGGRRTEGRGARGRKGVKKGRMGWDGKGWSSVSMTVFDSKL